MSMSKFESILIDFEQSVNRLQEVLEQPKNEFIRDSAIKRFEIVFDLSWKTLKAFLEEEHNVRCVSPKSCFREAYNKNIITAYDPFWLELANLRNYTVHTYRKAVAEKVYDALPKALTHLETLQKTLKDQSQTPNP